MIKKRLIIVFILLMIFFNSCNQYQKILKSSDLDYKFDKAVELFRERRIH